MRSFVSWVILIAMLIVFLLSGCAPQTEQPSQPAQSQQSGACQEHVDEDNNGACDLCNTGVVVNVDFYAINDLHGKFQDTTNQPGVDELTTFLKGAKFTDDNVILLSSGDMWQGSSESNLTQGNIMTEWMNNLGFTAMTLGNHEFDWGEDIIRENFEMADFPFLGINIYDRNTNERVEYCDSSVMVEVDGIKIGIIGAIGDCYSSIASDWSKDIYFLTGMDLTKLVMEEATKLRQEGAEFIVYSLHDGYGGNDYSANATDSMISGYYNTMLSDGYVDLMFEGHTHSYYVKQDKNGVYHLQGGGENQGIVHVEVNINYANDSSNVEIAEFIDTDTYSDFSDDEIVEELLTKYSDLVSIGEEVLGFNAYNRSGVDVRKTVAKLYYDFGVQQWGDEYPIVLGGGFLKLRSPGYLQGGKVTYAQLMMILPFDNFLVLCSVQGRDLVDKFLETENSNYFIYYGDYGASVKDNIDPNGTYYIIVDSYTSTYAPNNLTEIERYEERVFARDLYAEFVKAGNLE